MTGNRLPEAGNEDEQRASSPSFREPYPSSESSADERPAGRGPTSGRRTWSSALAIIVGIVLIVLIVVAHVTGVVGPGTH